MPALDSAATINGDASQLRDDVPVLIIGGGPSGLLQAYLLSQLGIRSLIIERYPNRLAAPKAHALSPRSLEICRQFSLDVNYIRSIGSQRRDAYWVNFVTSLSGEHVGKLPYERMDTSVLDSTPEMIHNIPQPKFEEVLAQELRRGDMVEIQKDTSFVSCYQEPTGHVVTTVEARQTGSLYCIRSQYMIGCDGAKSRVREFLDVQCEGEDSYETMMTIHFHADLRPVVGPNVGILHWVMDPEVSGFIIGYDLGGNQVLICNFDSEKFPANTWTQETSLHILRAAVGKDIPIEVLSHRPWILSRKVARQYRVGNVFLAGDAAHSFPPTGGLGLNSGLADVHNLAYKIAAAIQGWGNQALLDTYESDRRHVAMVNSQQSVKNGKKIFGLLKALGTTDKDLGTARTNLHSSLRDVEKRRKIDLEINEQQEHFDNLELHIGYVYGSAVYPSHASHYSDKYVPGARLPHAWISPLRTSAVQGVIPADLSYVSELNEADVHARKYSTLDLCAPTSFTLIQSSSSFAIERGTAVLALLQSELASRKQRRKTPLLKVVAVHRDFDMLPGSNGQSFLEHVGLEVGKDGGILVRPDQHILMLISRDTTPEMIFRRVRDHLFGGNECN